ncbi:MFS transporter [Actinoplanes sp. LDG1-01]|uniref:MFS transporter n=2 Tax=Paractinoplanes lichenicola TaxID=2802976 RepID=A0ABS1VK51_9ACTN|nr:MFS transporter [Actinoplanes lichenicola]
MVLGSILNPINSSMIAVALVPIGVALHARPAQTAWLVTGLYLATATGQPIVGKLVDRYGPRRLYLAGSALVGLAGVIGLLAPTLGVLVVARVLLGLGTCAGFPAAMYLIRRTGAENPRGVLTTLSVAAQTTVVIGPSLGGLLIGVAGWRAIFAVNIPLAVACVILALVRLPAAPPAPAREPLDLLGIALFIGMLTALMLVTTSPWLLAVAVVLGAAFALRELRTSAPFLDLRVFGGNGPLIATYVRALLAQTAAYAYLYGFTQWLEAGRGLTATHAGLILLPMSLLAIGVSTLSGRREGFRAKLLIGAGGQLVVSLLMLLLNGDSPLWLPVLLSVLCSLPQGLNSLANQNAVYYQADPARIGASSGLLRTFSYLGAMVSSAATGVFFVGGADTAGLHDLAVFLTVVAALLLVMVVADRSLGRLGRDLEVGR